jgi:MoaA/NifB/PqqE/SkfB family radical SAM enzyme
MKNSLPNNKVEGISLELTTFCNLKCKLCAHNYIEAKKLI